MLIEILMLAIATQGLDAVDDANLALTTCGFAAYRHANEQDQSLDQFARSLSSRCSEPLARMRQTVIALQIERGKSRAAASATADGLTVGFQQQFADQYAKRAESQAQLRELQRALREERKADAH